MNGYLKAFCAIGVLVGLASLFISLRTGIINLVPMSGPVKRSDFPRYHWVGIFIQIVFIVGCAALQTRF